MAGYTRQSVADIVNGANITAPPINAELNQLAAAFDASTGHSHDGSSGNSPKINLGTSVSGYLLPANGGSGGLNNVTATSVPTTSDDASAGYAPGSIWINGTTGRLYVCVANTLSNAFWVEALGVTPSNDVIPSANNLVDLGTSTYQFKDIYIDGTGYIDAVSGDTLTLTSNASVGGNLTLTGNAVISGNVTTTGTGYFGGNLTTNSNATVVGTAYLNGDVILGNAATDNVTFYGRVNTSVLPITDATYNLGAAANRWANLYLSGTGTIPVLSTTTGTIGTLTSTTATIGTLGVTGNQTVGGNQSVTGTSSVTSHQTVGGNLTVTGGTTLNGNTTVGNATSDTVTVNAEVASNLTPSTDDVRDLGSSTKQWRNLYIDGTANIDNLAADVATLGNATVTGSASLGSAVDINGGTIDGTPIGSNSTSSGAFTTVSASSGFTGNVTGNVTGDVTGNLTGNVTGNVTGNITGNIVGNVTGNVTASSGTSTFNDVTINGTLNMDAGTTATITNLTNPTNAQDAATKSYVDTSITNLIGGAPTALDTLNELAAALNDDANAYTTLDNKINTKVSKAGDTMTGTLSMGANKVTSTATPSATSDLTNKSYVDTQRDTRVAKSGDTMSGVLNMGSNLVSNVATPVSNTDAATKAYVDTVAGSATAAAASATSAANSATSASNSATAAAASAAAALVSENNAASSESAAATSETNAATSETNAASSASAASGSATAAANSASAAATSETNAANSASAASTSATNASNSATSAAGSATSAATSASQAAASAAQAASTYDSFDDRYLGSKASDPATDNDGNALVAGTLYFNTTDGKMRAYDGTNWIDASAAVESVFTIFKYTATAGQTTFTGNDDGGVSLAYVAPNLFVTINGIMLEIGTDYTATDGSSVVLTSGANVADEVNIYAIRSFSVADTVSAANGGTFYGNVTHSGNLTSTGITALQNLSTTNSALNISSSASDGSATIDASGNLLVGTTTTPFTVAGANGNLFVNGRTNSNSVAPLRVAKQGDTGNIIDIVAGSTLVGSIDSSSGAEDLIINSSDDLILRANGLNGVRIFQSGGSAQNVSIGATLLPDTDNSIDMGASSVRWRNLYLSGGVYLGGTGAANYLDDYEEGTWTPTFSSAIGSITYNSRSGRYTKVGNKVTATFWINWTSISGTGSYGVFIQNLPFTSASQISSERDIGSIIGAGFEGIPIQASDRHMAGGYVNNSSTTAYPRFSGGGTSEISLHGGYSTGGGYFYGTIIYFAA